MASKRGQITLFIVLGVLLVSLIGVFLYAKSSSLKGKAELPADMAPIKLFVDECLKSASKDSVVMMGFSGGYYLSYKKLVDVQGYLLPAHIYEGTFYGVPSKETIEKEMGDYVDDNMNECLGRLDGFQGFNITKGSPDTNATIIGKKIIFDTNLPIKIQKGGEITTISDFNSEVTADLPKMLKAADDYLNVQKDSPNEFAIGAVSNTAFNNGVGATFFAGKSPESYGVFSINLMDNITKIDGEPFTFIVNVKFNWVNTTSAGPSAFVSLEEIPPQSASVGETFYYALKATGDDVTYEANTNLFSITPQGIITFVPSDDDAGEHYYVITARDKHGNTDSKMLEINVKRMNTPPVILAIPDQAAVAGKEFVLDINATDKEDDFLEYIIENPQEGMDIDLDGVFTWVPKQAGQTSMTINVSDGEASSLSSFSIDVQ